MSASDSSSDSLSIERRLPASVDRVWQMWTDPVHFAAWYGPDGASVDVQVMDVHVGGERRISMAMQTPQGPMRMSFGGEHLDVDSPNHLAYSESPCDDDGGPVPAADLPAGYPAETRVVLDLTGTAESTTMRMTHQGVPADSGGAAGWAMAIDKLAVHLGSLAQD